MDKNFGQEILKKIEDKKILPEPKWRFLLKDYLIWLLAAVCLFVGSLAVAVILFVVLNNDWDLYRNATASFWQFFLAGLPYLWIILLALFVELIYYNLRHTKTGYRYRFRSIFFGTVLASVVLGAIFYNIGFGRAIERMLINNLPFYERFSPQHRLWQRADRGVLGGIIVNIGNNGKITIRDPFGHNWQVDAATIETIGNSGELQVGQRVRIIGRRQAGDTFEAKIIKPVFGPPPGPPPAMR
jgi:hypothetical protein